LSSAGGDTTATSLRTGRAQIILALSVQKREGVVPDRIVYSLPYEFVEYLTSPGLDTMAGTVALKQYMSLSKANGGNANIDALLTALRATGVKDDITRKTVDQQVGPTELNLLWKGQGHPDAFVTMMDFLCENQDQLKGKPGTLGGVYNKYFKENRDAVALQLMVRDKYFGIDCIGFVSNYLRYVGIWDKYYGYEIDQWDRVFTKNVKKLEDIGPLNLLVWPGKHIALVDWKHGVANGKADIDVCQSSSGGPQVNEHATLTYGGSLTAKGYTLFSINGGSPQVPVTGTCYVMRWPGLEYGTFIP
jgi:hypothetical protein